MDNNGKLIGGLLGLIVFGGLGYLFLSDSPKSTKATVAVGAPKGGTPEPLSQGPLSITCDDASVVSGTGNHQARVPKEDGAIYLWTVTGGAVEGLSHLDAVSWTAGEGAEVSLHCKMTRKDGTVVEGSLKIPVQKSPVLTRFSATPAVICPGDKAMLSWEGRHVKGLVLTPGGEDVSKVSGSGYEVKPTETTTYTLTATSGAGLTTSLETTVKVIAQPVISAFKAEPVSGGQGYTLSATFQHGKAEIVSGGAVLGSSEVSPLTVTLSDAKPGTAATLTVRNEAGTSVSQSLTFAAK